VRHLASYIHLEIRRPGLLRFEPSTCIDGDRRAASRAQKLDVADVYAGRRILSQIQIDQLGEAPIGRHAARSICPRIEARGQCQVGQDYFSCRTPMGGCTELQQIARDAGRLLLGYLHRRAAGRIRIASGLNRYSGLSSSRISET
jgi:hypothetical protein